MARTPTTHDPFNAVAEPKRRQVLEILGVRELSVNEIVKKLGWTQPMKAWMDPAHGVEAPRGAEAGWIGEREAGRSSENVSGQRGTAQAHL